MKHLMRYVAMAAASAALSVVLAVPGLADESRKAADSHPVKLVVDSDYITGKVNDPVSKQSKTAFIVCDNAQFHLEANDESAPESVEVVFYMNEYVDGQDKGARNRIQMSALTLNESSSMLPDDVFDEQVENGAAYDFINRCYDVRVYMDEAQTVYRDYYFGLVDELTYDRMYADMLEQQAAEAQKAERRSQ